MEGEKSCYALRNLSQDTILTKTESRESASVNLETVRILKTPMQPANKQNNGLRDLKIADPLSRPSLCQYSFSKSTETIKRMKSRGRSTAGRMTGVSTWCPSY